MYIILTKCKQNVGSEHSAFGSNPCEFLWLEFQHMYPICIYTIETYLKLAKARNLKVISFCETNHQKPKINYFLQTADIEFKEPSSAFFPRFKLPCLFHSRVSIQGFLVFTVPIRHQLNPNLLSGTARGLL